jgi:hypothetical protein
VWHGRLAAELGLTGVVGPDQLRALLLGRDPITDMELLAAKGRPRTITAYDVTFSAPKWVSLLWAFASPEVAAVASIAPMEAVAAALDLLERRAGATRQQTDGVRQRIPTGVGGHLRSSARHAPIADSGACLARNARTDCRSGAAPIGVCEQFVADQAPPFDALLFRG